MKFDITIFGATGGGFNRFRLVVDGQDMSKAQLAPTVNGSTQLGLVRGDGALHWSQRMTKILVTCPPMLGQIDLFKERLEALGCDVTAAEVVQVLTGTS